MFDPQLFIAYPALGAAIMVALCLVPLALIFRRRGQAPILALLLLPSVVFPFIGFILAGLALLLAPPRRRAC